MSERRKLVHVERIPIRWGDMDAMGHVNNTVYFRYMEQARIGWFDALLPEAEAWKSTGIVVANASCNFKRAIAVCATRSGLGVHIGLMASARGWLAECAPASGAPYR